MINLLQKEEHKILSRCMFEELFERQVGEQFSWIFLLKRLNLKFFCFPTFQNTF